MGLEIVFGVIFFTLFAGAFMGLALALPAPEEEGAPVRVGQAEAVRAPEVGQTFFAHDAEWAASAMTASALADADEFPRDDTTESRCLHCGSATILGAPAGSAALRNLVAREVQQYVEHELRLSESYLWNPSAEIMRASTTVQ